MEQETKDLIANQVALELGKMIGKAMRLGIILAGVTGLVMTAAGSGEKALAEAKPAATAPAKSKPHIAHKAKKRHYKKCQCDCKKVVDKPAEPVKVISIENVEERLTNDQIGPV